MSFSRYPAYKDSGVEWLGEVPEHWDICPLKRDLAFLTSGSRGWAENYADNGELFLRITNLTRSSIDLDLSDIQRVEVPPGTEGSRTKVRAGDVLFSITAYLGSVAVIPDTLEAAYVSQHVALARLRFLRLTSRWVGYAAISIIGKTWFETQSYGGTKIQLSLDDVRCLPLTVPPIEEQTSIAAFLDRETAKIDALVAEQQRLIDLLKEKRQAVISHAVTKGLNPAAPMKPSGIEWLGDVPAHWRILKGSLIGMLFGSEQIPEEMVSAEGDLPFIKVGSMSSESFAIESWDWFVDRSVAGRYNPHSGFIVFPKRGAAIFLNKVNVVDRPSLIDPNLMGWVIGDQANPLFIAYALKTRKLDELADVSTVPQINNKHIGPERFPIPPAQEQFEIVRFLGTETAKIDTLTTEAQLAINLLQERRTALISAAVTGQIDVRHLAETGAA